METKPFEVGKTYLRVDGTPVTCIEIRRTEDGIRFGAKFDDFGEQSWRYDTPDMRGRRTGAKSSTSSHTVAFIVGALLAGGGIWAILNVPGQTDEVDRNGDGKVDERFFYSGGRLDRSEADRNFDGRVDEIFEYERSGDTKLWRGDDDFDGRLESTLKYLDGQPQRFELDRDGDGMVDMRTLYDQGVAVTTEYMDRASRRVVKQVRYRGGKPASTRLDLDADGRFERAYDFNAIDEPIGN